MMRFKQNKTKIFLVTQWTALFISAGTIYWIHAWVYIGLQLFFFIVALVVLKKTNPQLIQVRRKFIQKDTKRFDTVFFACWIPLTYIALIIAGIDAVRHQWSTIPFELTVFAVFFSLLAFLFALWAVAVNPYFETTVRVQQNRNHQVCSSGPYKIVRHPGYAAWILARLAVPLILGSWWGFIPSTAIVLLLVIRTALEDRTLQKELAGYDKYTAMTRYRLIPFVW